MDKKTLTKALNFSIIDGSLSAIMGSLCGGIFLIGFVLKVLEADPGKIGLLASLPMFANLIQLFGSHIIEKTGKSKQLCLISVGISRTLWLLIVLLPFKIFSSVADYRIWIVVAVIAASSLFSSMAGVGWLSWMSDIVPAESRGTYFGKRNMITSFFGMLFIFMGGKFITFWGEKYTPANPFGFIIIFAAGIAAGLTALVFLAAIPQADIPKNTSKESSSRPKFITPFKDPNFTGLIVFAAIWIFAVNIAAPFYGVYMINVLHVEFDSMASFGIAATLATLVMMKTWGPITDKLGNKPVIILSGFVLIFVPVIWILTPATTYYLPIMAAHVLSGAFMAGAGLSQFNILIKISPKEGRSVYLAVFAAVTGLAGATAPLAGGFIFNFLKDFSATFWMYDITGLHFVFLLSGLLIAVSLIFGGRIIEEGSATPVAVILQIRNDLNPQSGISGAADILMLKVKKGENILKKIDRKSDELAEKSEKAVKKALEGTEKIARKPAKKIKDFFKDDE